MKYERECWMTVRCGWCDLMMLDDNDNGEWMWEQSRGFVCVLNDRGWWLLCHYGDGDSIGRCMKSYEEKRLTQVGVAAKG